MYQYPASNFHDLNLDWLLEQMKNCLAEWEETKTDWENLEADNTEFKAYVTNYLQNLDVSDDISAKIDALIADGTFLELLTEDTGDGSPLSDVVGTWLNAHITQETGYVIDDTLTVQGAAADAKAAGDAIADLKGTISDYTNTTSKPNKFNKSDLIDGGYYNATGEIINAQNWAYSPTYAEVTAGSVYYGKYRNVSVWANGLLAIAWYDSNKQFISQMYNKTTYTAPINAAYVRISYNKESCNDSLVFADFQATKEYEYGLNYALQENVKIPAFTLANRLKNKILCCAGDSITYGADMDAEGITQVSDITMYQSDSSGDFSPVTNNFIKSWGYQIAERNAMTFYNAGVSGSTMQGVDGINGFSLENGRYTKLPEHIDYLVIWFGYNDAAYGTLGTIDDEANDSYYGGYNVVLPYLINKYPYAKIALIVPYGVGYQRRQAVRLLGNKWGVAVWDNFNAGTPLYYEKEPSVGVLETIVTENRAKFQASGAHPNYKGHTQLADMIEDFLRRI